MLQKLCKCMLLLCEVEFLAEMLSENVHLEVLEMAGTLILLGNQVIF